MSGIDLTQTLTIKDIVKLVEQAEADIDEYVSDHIDEMSLKQHEMLNLASLNLVETRDFLRRVNELAEDDNEGLS